MLQKADAQTSMLQAQVVHLQEQMKDKTHELMIKNYDAETDRLKAVGCIDPVSLQIIVRQMVQDMLQTDIIPHLAQHSAIEGRIQQNLQPQQPQQPGPTALDTAHSMADLAQKHADIVNTHADTATMLQPPQPQNGGNGNGAQQPA